jgi:transcriptional repressor NrdR
MVCPFCLHKKTDIYNTRHTDSGQTVWRRRSCLQCGRAFTTEEHINPTRIWTVVGTKKTKPYSRAKLAMSLLKACDHRPNYDDAAWYLYESVEQKLAPIAAENHLLTTTHIAEVAASILKNFDPTAYVKYLSYHQPAMDAKTLRKHLRRG